MTISKRSQHNYSKYRDSDCDRVERSLLHRKAFQNNEGIYKQTVSSDLYTCFSVLFTFIVNDRIVHENKPSLVTRPWATPIDLFECI